jgi:hypothetical protein
MSLHKRPATKFAPDVSGALFDCGESILRYKDKNYAVANSSTPVCSRCELETRPLKRTDSNHGHLRNPHRDISVSKGCAYIRAEKLASP